MVPFFPNHYLSWYLMLSVADPEAFNLVQIRTLISHPIQNFSLFLAQAYSWGRGSAVLDECRMICPGWVRNDLSFHSSSFSSSSYSCSFSKKRARLVVNHHISYIPETVEIRLWISSAWEAFNYGHLYIGYLCVAWRHLWLASARDECLCPP